VVVVDNASPEPFVLHPPSYEPLPAHPARRSPVVPRCRSQRRGCRRLDAEVGVLAFSAHGQDDAWSGGRWGRGWRLWPACRAGLRLRRASWGGRARDRRAGLSRPRRVEDFASLYAAPDPDVPSVVMRRAAFPGLRPSPSQRRGLGAVAAAAREGAPFVCVPEAVIRYRAPATPAVILKRVSSAQPRAAAC